MADRLPDGVREAVKDRDGNACVLCGRRSENLHHRRPAQRLAGDHSPANLLSLCGSGTTGCHGWIEVHREFSLDLGWLIGQTDMREADRIPVWRPGMGHKGWADLRFGLWGPPDWSTFRKYGWQIEEHWLLHVPDRITGPFEAVAVEMERCLWNDGVPPSLVGRHFETFCKGMEPGSQTPSLAARFAFAAGAATNEWKTISERWTR